MNDLSDGDLSDSEQPNSHWSQNAITFDTCEKEIKVRGFINGDSIMKITLVVMFVAEFARSIQNVWITTLLMQYGIHPWLDCVIWSLPIFLSIAVKPYLENYTARFLITVATYIDIIFLFLLVGAGGHYLLTLSTSIETVFNFATFPLPFAIVRILIATVGWVTIDLCLEMVLTYNDNVKAYLIENKISSYVDSKMRKYEQSMTVAAKLSGYLLSMLICSPPFTFRNFHLQLNNMFYVSGLMWINSAFFIKKVSIIRVSKGVEKYYEDISVRSCLDKFGRTLREVRWFNTETYFYGMEDTMKANLKLKMILAVFFSFNTLADLTDFYATAWMVLNLHTTYLTYAGIYIRGVSLGAFVLAVSAIVTFYYKRRNRPSSIRQDGDQKESVPISFSYKYLVCISLNVLMTTYALFTGSIVALWFVVGLEGWLRGMSQLYLEKRYEMLSKFYPQYQRCQQFVFTMQKLFVLLVLPLFCWFLQGSRAAEGCLLTSLALLLLMFAIQAAELVRNKKQQMTMMEKKLN